MPDYVKYDPNNGRILMKWSSVDPHFVSGETNLLEITRVVFNSLNKYKKVSGVEVVDMTQAEMEALDLEEEQALQAAETARLTALDDDIVATRNITLTKVEQAIDNIGNLNDAKVFLKRLCRFIATRL